MKNPSKRIVALSLAIAMCVSMVACSGKSTSSQATTSTKPTTSTSDADKYKEHMSISIALWNIGDYIVTGPDAVRDAIYKKFNIDIVPLPVTWGDYREKISLWAASNKLPDMTAFEAGYTDVFTKWTTQNVVRALPSDLSAYPNLQKVMSTDDAKQVNNITSTTTDAKYYGIPRPTYSDVSSTMLDYGILLRKDWMEKVGVTKVPANTDELISLLKKFQTEDPDGNGKNDTIGLTGYNFAWMTTLFNGICPGAVNGFKWVFDADGSIIPAWKSTEFLAAMKNMKKVYDAGVLDPDYIILKGEEGRDKFKNGKAGAYAHEGPDLANLKVMEENFKTIYPNKTLDQILTYIPWYPNKDGKILYPTSNLSWSETYLSSKVSDAKAERCMALMDYLLSDEGYNLVSLGIEGVDYKKGSDGKITLIDTKDAKGKVKTMAEKYPASGLQALANWTSYRSASSPAYSDTIKKMASTAIKDQLAAGAIPAKMPQTNGIVLEDTAELATADGEFNKMVNDLMTAPDVDKAWKAMVDSYMTKGYDQVIIEENKLYNAGGRK